MRVDMIAGVEHDLKAAQDYRRLEEFNILTARDAARWHLIDRAFSYDFSSFAPMLQASLDAGVQVIWDLCHYGWPGDVDLLTPEFVDRFAKYSATVARFVREHTDEIPFYSPINEINFMVWGSRPARLSGQSIGGPVSHFPSRSSTCCLRDHGQISRRPLSNTVNHNLKPGT
jgi:hypothetical protein